MMSVRRKRQSSCGRLRSAARAVIESVEPRVMMSGTVPHHKVRPLPKGDNIKSTIEFATRGGIIPANTGNPDGASVSVNAVRGAYGLGIYNSSSVVFNGVQGTGVGQTIAIVDAYDYPTIQADMTTFDNYYKLPAPPSLTRVSESGSTTSLPGTDSSGGWEGEEALDVEWAHAMAPQANIVLVECNSPNDLFNGVSEAESISGVSVVSMSWTSSEFGGEQSYDSAYFNHAGITFLAAAGDAGAAANYPASSPNVLGVGGTALTVTGNNTSGYAFSSETAWADSGGGISSQEALPAFQAGNINGLSSTYRTIPDIAAIASGNTPVAECNSFLYGTSAPWEDVAGTSVACPIWGGIIAVVNQGRVAAGLYPLNTGTTATATNPTQAATKIYGLPQTDFHDITSGSNGYSAGVGYDLVTGRGSPAGPQLFNGLVSGTMPESFTATTRNAVFTLQLDPTGVYDQILLNGSSIAQYAKSVLSTLTFNMNGSFDSFILNGANGNPVPSGGVTVIGSSAGGDSLTLIGTSGNDAITFSTTAIGFSSTTINYSIIQRVYLNPGSGLNSLAVNSGAATVLAANAGSGILTRKFSSVAVSPAASLVFATAAAHTDRTLVLTASLNIASGGVVDLGGNDLIDQGGAGPTGSLSLLTALATSGYGRGNWSGTGLISSAAASDTSHLTALGVAPGSAFSGATFDGYAPAANDVLVKFTYYGDANLDGKVDGSDYSKIDAGYGTTATGWSNGDFNYDSSIDGSDYSLIDNDFNNQGTPL